MSGARNGTLHVVGVGPGDPELLTLKAARIVGAVPVVAFFAKRGSPSRARTIAGAHVRPGAEELRFEFPFTTELATGDGRYHGGTAALYAAAAERVAERLRGQQDVALLCEGDPFFYGSAINLFERLAPEYPCAVVPGVTGMSGCWSDARLPIVRGEGVLTVVPGTLDSRSLAGRLAGCDAAVIMKVGRNLPKIRAALREAGRAERAVYVECGTTARGRVLPVAEASDPAPYFSLVLVPGQDCR